MSFEVEVKYRGWDRGTLVRKLQALGAVGEEEVEQEDLYLGHPARDFAQTREALRLRRSGESIRITYKGPRRPGPTKTRKEIEISLGEGSEQYLRLRELFEVLGFEPVAVIRKRRECHHLTYQGRSLEIALDTAEGLGDFVEIEAFAESELELPAVQQTVLELGRELGLQDVEPRSYLRMVLDRRSAGQSPAETSTPDFKRSGGEDLASSS